MTQDELVVKAKSGDRAAMEALLASVAPSLHRFALRMCRHDADAEDTLQDALLSFATHLDGFEGRSSLSSWSFALVRSACARRRRGKKNQPSEAGAGLADAADDALGPEERAAERQLGEAVTRALDGLSDSHREVLLLRDAEGLTAPEAAAALGITVDALKSRLHRARAALREALAPVLEPDALVPSAGCPDVVRALSEQLEGQIDARSCAELERHVSSCPACARTCGALRSALRVCKQSPTPTPHPEVQAQVQAALDAWLATRR
jgi:RNA polymerase sigma-70 factor (ECF subfamily)